MKTVILIFLGGGSGSVVRYVLGKWVNSWHQSSFPFGTLTVNTIACLVLGLVIGFADHKSMLSADARVFWAVGFCGGFSTFSTFSNETLTLLQSGLATTSLLYILSSLLLCLVATYAGILLASFRL